MTEPGCVNGKVARDEAQEQLVRDVMVRRPKTMPAGCSVAELRAHFENPHVRTALLVEDGRFAGAIAPEELPATAGAAEPARAYARVDVPTMRPDASMADALALMERRGDHRLVVVGDDGEMLVGLLCLDRAGASFCVDAPAPAPQAATASSAASRAPATSASSLP
jgi:predicted transcriptional regulator